MKSTPRLLFASAVAAVALLLGGCVYLRQLQFKSQFADFHRYFAIDERDGLAIICRVPVVRDEDFAQLLKLAPESRSRAGTSERWHLCWVTEPAATDVQAGGVTADLEFVDHRLARITLPESFFAHFPKAGFVAGLRSIGNAPLDQRNGSAKACVSGSGGEGSREADLFPSKAQMQAILGTPVSTKESPHAIECRYRLNAASPAQNFGRIDLAITFDRASGRMQRVGGTLLFGTVDLLVAARPARGVAAERVAVVAVI